MAQKTGQSGPKNRKVAQKRVLLKVRKWPKSGPKVAQSGPKNGPKVAQKVVNGPKSGPQTSIGGPKNNLPKKVAQTSSVWPIKYGKSGPNPNKRVKVAQKRVFGGPSGPTTKFFQETAKAQDKARQDHTFSRRHKNLSFLLVFVLRLFHLFAARFTLNRSSTKDGTFKNLYK